MRGSRVPTFVAHAVPIHLPFFDEWSHWTRSKVVRSDLCSLALISGLIIWSRYADISFDNFYQFMTTSFKFEDINHNINATNSTSNTSNTSKFFESLIEHLPGYLSWRLIKHSTATISLVYCILFISFLLFSSPIYQLRYIRNRSFSGYSFLVYFIYCWLFISMLSHLPIIHQLVEEPLALFPYFYALTVITVSTINIIFRIILNRIFVFHIGPRKRTFEILQSSAFISLACSMLYANCGNTFEIFELTPTNQQSVHSILFCQKLFESVALSGNKTYNEIPPVLTMWLTGVTIMCVNYIIEGTVKDRFIFFSTKDLNPITQYIETEVVTINNHSVNITPTNTNKSPSRSSSRSSSINSSSIESISSSCSSSCDEDEDDNKLDTILKHEFDGHDNRNIASSVSSIQSMMESQSTTESVITPKKCSNLEMDGDETKDDIDKNTIIRRIIHSAEPRDVHEMTSWFAMSTGWVLLDLVIALGIFLDRYDRRELNNSLTALQATLNKYKYKYKYKDDDKKQQEKIIKNKHKNNSINQGNGSLTPPISSSNSCNFIPSPLKLRNPSDLSDTEQCATSCFTYFAAKNELWFDFMADCGDGFHPSYEIARLLAQPHLIGVAKNSDIRLQRANLLLIGGDLSYPGPTNDNYQKKFFRVFEDAMRPPEEIMNSLKENTPKEISYRKPQLPDGDTLESYGGPSCLMIPGNHDWYDGLQTFSRFVCNRNWIGGWYLPQTSSYFVSVLPHNWWIFAADYALNGDIDTKQFQYFAKVVETYFDDDIRNERVIIITHLPDWIINDHEGSSYGDNVQYLINNIIGEDRLRLRLSGDIHNYTRHESMTSIQSGLKYNMVSDKNKKKKKNENKVNDDDYRIYQDIPLQSSSSNLKGNLKRSRSAENIRDYFGKTYTDPTLIVSGGGGAFLHPTHVPESKPILVNGTLFDRVCEYPSIGLSKRYAFFNIFGFRKRNLQFDLLGGILYYLMVSSLFPLCNMELNDTKILEKFIQIFIANTFEVFERSYISVSVFFLGFFGLYFWTESHLSMKLRLFIATIHLLAHYVASMTVIILMEMIIEAALENELIGIKSPFDTFQTHFQKTHDVLQHVDNNYTFGIITNILRILFTVIDITGFHVSLRKLICASKYKQIQLLFEKFKDFPTETILQSFMTNNTLSTTPSRFSRVLYHITAFLFYFIFAAPVVSFIVGLHLFLSAKCGKFNEVFSSLRLDKHKNFVRFHLKSDGSLHCFVIGVDKVPHRWRQDPKWNGRGTLLSIQSLQASLNHNNNDNNLCNRIISNKNNIRQRSKSMEAILNARDMRYLPPSYSWNYPSRWISYNSSGNTNMSQKYEYRRVKIIDQFVLH